MFGVSCWTIYRRIEEYNLQNLQRFSDISDEDVDAVIKDYMSPHGSTTGEPFISGYFRSKGIFIPQSQVRNRIHRATLGALISCQTYYVPWSNSLWHIDGHHSLIRWKLVIHGCVDGKSRKVMFLHCNKNNLSQTVLALFLNAIDTNGGLWPSRICVDHGVENVSVCEAMLEKRGAGRGKGNLTPNQIWANGMVNEENPLAHNILDEAPEDVEFYGKDQEYASVFTESTNNVVVSPGQVQNG
eukprot:gene1071-411_t